VRTYRDAAIKSDLARLTSQARPRALQGVTTIGSHPISIHESAKVSPGVILDAEAGPIFIDEDAVVRPGAIIVGPVYVGPHVTVLDRCLLKSCTARSAPTAKIAGEVGGTIFQGFANKAHDGHLGDSWVGEWANLGAGTTNSNLLNTYDQVICRATPGGPNERTGEQFLGAIIGDHVKFAICSRIMTGSILHTGCMFAQSAAVSGCVGGVHLGDGCGLAAVSAGQVHRGGTMR
jgi:NDP-sugar pyrophosphorylase family protein